MLARGIATRLLPLPAAVACWRCWSPHTFFLFFCSYNLCDLHPFQFVLCPCRTATACTIYPAGLALQWGVSAHVWTWRDVISQNLRDEISSKRGCGLRNNVNIKDLARSAARHTVRTADRNTSACSKSFLKAAFDFFFFPFLPLTHTHSTRTALNSEKKSEKRKKKTLQANRQSPSKGGHTKVWVCLTHGSCYSTYIRFAALTPTHSQHSADAESSAPSSRVARSCWKAAAAGGAARGTVLFSFLPIECVCVCACVPVCCYSRGG